MRIFITGAEEAEAKNGSKYIRVRYVLEDKIPKTAVLFDSNLSTKDLTGQVCEVSITSPTSEKMSDKIERIEIVPDADKAAFIRITKFDIKELTKDLKKWTRGEGFDAELTKIADKVLFSIPARINRFSTWPAASTNHHAYQGGLIEHTWAMCKMANALIETDPALAGINKDVVLTAIVLHDIAKIVTYDFKPGTGMSAERNDRDTLLGHIAIADELIIKACMEENISTVNRNVLHLRHCILSHHGKKEWGAAIVPATREAVLIHQIDMMQSRDEMASEAISGLGKDVFRTPYVRPLDSELIKL